MQTGEPLPEKPWGGRFSEATDQEVLAYTESISFDQTLWRQDIRGSGAHARMLVKVGVLTEEEGNAILQGLSEIAGEFERGSFPVRIDLEDIHMNIERRLFEKIGTPAHKLHTARSRNDQVALDLRLYVVDETAALSVLIRNLIEVVLSKAEETVDLLMPGYTHLQPAQPITGGYYYLCHAERLLRDLDRMQEVGRRAGISPLGSGALAGTTFPIDRTYVADLLGLSGITGNGLDAVSDRDFAADFLHALSLLMVHLSQWAEEWILWSTVEFSVLEIPDRYMTGSSMMPQKKNPDILELTRGRAGRVLGDYVSLMTLLKGLPGGYNRDLQEDKEQLFDGVSIGKRAVSMMTSLCGGARLKGEKLRSRLSSGGLLATDMAEDLVRMGVPFREAHAIVGRIVAYSDSLGLSLSEIPDEELARFYDGFPKEYAKCLTPEMAVSRRNHPGGPARERVLERIGAIRSFLAGMK
ncbi:MAG: argininosuccinate lyase [Leptospirillum sp.]